MGRWRARLLVLSALASACSQRGNAPDASAQDASIDASAVLAVIANAEDTRRADLISDDMRASREVEVRRHAARALARIADAPSEAGLLRALGDEDAETSAWGAYGLGFSCKGHEDARVRALAARAISLDSVDAGADARASVSPIDVRFAIARALGRCGGAAAEVTLAAWMRAKGPWREDAAYGLGDIAAHRGGLDDDTVTVLLDAAGDGVSAALYPFARAERFNDAFSARLLDVARKTLARPATPERVFAVRALAKCGDAAIGDLSTIATAGASPWPERIDAMRALGKLGDPGRAAAGDALAHVAPDGKDPFAMLAVAGDVYGEIVVGLAALGQAPLPSATHVLTVLSTLKPPGEAPAPLARRFAEIRCTAASLLSQGAYDSQTINACDAAGSEPLEHAKLAALLRRPIVLDRRLAWVALTKSQHLKVREEALAAFAQHRELGDVGLAAIASALGDTAHAGVVASAAEVLFAHPDRALVLAAKEKRNALDPNAPPPSVNPAQDLAPVIAKALAAALAFKWKDDAIETRGGLLDAAAVLHAPGALEAAKAACSDVNLTMRDHATRALRALGDDKTTCAAPPNAAPAKEVASPHGGKLVLTTDAGTLSIVFDPDLAPVASTRILDLARAGFFDGQVIHRVVPAFVVQLGDPQGDGYGGGGQSLRCETSPVPFAPFDVGIAIAGRDTGSTQFFVTLARFPHLDGDYAHIGHAEGDWLAVAEGDLVKQARVE